MKHLNPTLWRTCRVLSGENRLRLLRSVVEQPGQNVSQLAERMLIGVSNASQELRRLQSRGLLKRSCHGRSVIYLPIPDPQVSSARPLLKALQAVWADRHADVKDVARIATGLGCERRIILVRSLSQQPRNATQLAETARTDPDNLKSHLRLLKASGWIAKERKLFVLRPASHPVMAALLELL